MTINCFQYIIDIRENLENIVKIAKNRQIITFYFGFLQNIAVHKLSSIIVTDNCFQYWDWKKIVENIDVNIGNEQNYIFFNMRHLKKSPKKSFSIWRVENCEKNRSSKNFHIEHPYVVQYLYSQWWLVSFCLVCPGLRELMREGQTECWLDNNFLSTNKDCYWTIRTELFFVALMSNSGVELRSNHIFKFSNSNNLTWLVS